MSGPAGPHVATASAKADLVERARAGEHDAFAILARAAFGRMYGAAKLILRDPYRAEDAVQEALVVAWRHIGAIRAADAWDVWLYRITVRVCYRMARSTRDRQVVALDVQPDRESPASDFAGAIVEREQIVAALASLTLEQRAVIVLHFYLDLTLAQVAVVLDVPAGTAKSRLNRGLAALRLALGDDTRLEAAEMRERPT